MVIWLYAIYSCALNSTKSKSLIIWNIYSESGETLKFWGQSNSRTVFWIKSLFWPIFSPCELSDFWPPDRLSSWSSFEALLKFSKKRRIQSPYQSAVSRTFLFSWGIHDKGKAAGWKVVSGHDSHYRRVFHSNLPPFPRFHSGSAPRGKGRESS